MNIEITYDNTLLEGVILERDKFFIKVQLTSPFVAWENHSIISGIGTLTPHHFLTEYGDKTIRRLLIESYQKTKTLYESLDRISNVYINLKNELKELNDISNAEIRGNIKSKLEDWFFNTIFSSRVSGLIASYNDRKYIIEIIEDYLKQNDEQKKWDDYFKRITTISKKYKTIKETPFATSGKKYFNKITRVVSREEFLREDEYIPLLVANQFRIYPDEFKDLKLLKGRKIALLGITYLSGIESEIKEYFLDEKTIYKIVTSFNNSFK